MVTCPCVSTVSAHEGVSRAASEALEQRVAELEQLYRAAEAANAEWQSKYSAIEKLVEPFRVSWWNILFNSLVITIVYDTFDYRSYSNNFVYCNASISKYCICMIYERNVTYFVWRSNSRTTRASEPVLCALRLLLRRRWIVSAWSTSHCWDTRITSKRYTTSSSWRPRITDLSRYVRLYHFIQCCTVYCYWGLHVLLTRRAVLQLSPQNASDARIFCTSVLMIY